MWNKLAYRNYFLTAIVINIGILLLLILFKSFLPPRAPLFYGRPMGEAQLTSTFGLLIAPGVSLMMTLLNLFLSLWAKDSFIKRLLAISAIVVSVLTAITITKIVSLVGFF
ncbi:MAG: hypothetical protein UV71_C0001G0066 [Microgenomates group bacterium GW2011_GWC1_43_13]|nr:MAG: hypothetical protein UV71_C0001G0066 [Microgenomates group bacterium GW2011_GWC1_43_13]